MQTVNEFLSKVMDKEIFKFEETIAVIDQNYIFTPTAFKNGNQINDAGQNNGSCKVFSFAKRHHLTKEETLFLFGEHYQSVQTTPEATDHQNIRNFMTYGWEGIAFEGEALETTSV